MEFKVISYNTLHCSDWKRKVIDYDKIASVVGTADVVGMNEIRDKGTNRDYEPQVGIMSQKLGMNGYFGQAILFTGDNPYGNGLLSRYPILRARTVPIPDPPRYLCDNYKETRAVIDATLDLGFPLHVLVTHFGLNLSEAANAVDTVVSLIDDTPTVLMGDFNLTPDDPLLRPIRDRMTDTADFFDDKGKLSWPADEPTMKIDYVFVRGLDVVSADIPATVVSDHRPHVAVLRTRG